MDNKQRFKEDLQFIEIEVFNYCNRTCWFCPNSFIDRRSDVKLMDRDKYINILKQLAEIGFDGELSYSRYNEPLAKKDIILDRIRLARKYLPNVTLRTNSNGDYLTRDYVLELRDAGLDQLWAQDYQLKKYSHDLAKKQIGKKIEKLGFDFEVVTDIDDYKYEVDLKVEGMLTHIRARNFAVDGSDRGGTLKEIANDYVRTKRCIQPTKKMYIDYTGDIVVCCNMRSDVPEHTSGVMGHIDNGYLWDTYYNSRYDIWRDHHKEDGEKSGFCKGCRIDL